MSRTLVRQPALTALPLLLIALALAVMLVQSQPVSLSAFWAPDMDRLADLQFYYSFLPRLAMALLCGAALGLAGLLMQQVLGNPLASPTTLGVAAGAQLAMASASLLLPAGWYWGSEWIAFLGGAVATGLVFALAWRGDLNPVRLILSGLVVSLYLGAINAALILFNKESLSALLIWGAGSLSQHNWSDALALAPRVLVAAVLALVLIRPLAVLSLGDASARSIGVSLRHVRIAALGLAVFLTACVVSTVGVIGFIGLAAPALARLSGARTVASRLLWSTVIGAALLWLTDMAVQWLAGGYRDLLPTGAVTALLGAPLLLWLVPRLLSEPVRPESAPLTDIHRPAPPSRYLALATGLLAVLAVALFLGQDADGWRWLSLDSLGPVLQWRAPRVAGALAAGAMLALAGTVTQRLTHNPMASPEVLGISAGAAMGIVALTFIYPAMTGRLGSLAFGAAGAGLTLILILRLTGKGGFGPQRLVLAGIAISALLDAVMALILASGDPRALTLLGWMAGSTYRLTAIDSAAAIGFLLVLAPIVLITHRWLDLLSLGDAIAQGTGVSLRRSRGLLLLLVALLTGAATLLVGPLSFVGLMAPHLARLMGFTRALPQLLGALLIGSGLMVVADWLGRQVIFPYEIPAGLMAALVGGLYFMAMLYRSRQ